MQRLLADALAQACGPSAKLFNLCIDGGMHQFLLQEMDPSLIRGLEPHLACAKLRRLHDQGVVSEERPVVLHRILLAVLLFVHLHLGQLPFEGHVMSFEGYLMVVEVLPGHRVIGRLDIPDTE